MLKYPCLLLDHDDTVVQSEKSVNYPYFCCILDSFRPGAKISWEQYSYGCFHLGFAEMCRRWYSFTEEEMEEEFQGWKAYIMEHTPPAFPGIADVIRRYKAEGGKIFVVSHSSRDNITRDYLAHIGLLPDGIYGWDLPEHLRKPSTYAIEDIAQKFSIPRGEMLIVDDMKPACDMAKAAGVSIAFAAWGRLEQEEIRSYMESHCDYSFYSPQELADFLFI